jgi:hypothetical protein
MFDFSPAEEENMVVINNAISYFGKIEYFGATQFSDPTVCPVVLEIGERVRRPLFGVGSHHNQFLNDLFSTFEDNKVFFEDYVDFVSTSGLGLIYDIEFKSQTIESNSYEVRTGGSFRKTKKDKKIIIPYVGVDGLNLSFNQLSEGTFKTLALVFYILRSEGNLMIIEEPETCIHHGLLSSVMELIKEKSKESQLIVSTHSDYLLDKLKPENIILVEKMGELGTSANLLTKKLSSNDYKALKNYLQESGNLGDYWKESGFPV